jgi:orotidine-5'-phosphate decarboxylase
VGTPQEALDRGADLLVIGRAVTAADDPVAAAGDLLGPLA